MHTVIMLDRKAEKVRQDNARYKAIAGLWANEVLPTMGIEGEKPPGRATPEGRALFASVQANADETEAALRWLATSPDAAWWRDKRPGIDFIVKKKRQEWARNYRHPDKPSAGAHSNSTRGYHPPIAEPPPMEGTDEELLEFIFGSGKAAK